MVDNNISFGWLIGRVLYTYEKIKLVIQHSTISLGNFLDFFLLLERVGGLHVALLDIDDLIGQHFSDGLERSEGVLSDSLGD